MREDRDFLRQPGRQASTQAEQALLVGRLQAVS